VQSRRGQRTQTFETSKTERGLMQRTVTLKNGQVFQIALLTVAQAQELLAAHDAIGVVKTPRDSWNLIEARLRTVQQSLTNAGPSPSLAELENMLTFPDLDELFHAIANLCGEYSELPAFSKRRCSGHNPTTKEPSCR